jgi:DNA ligase-1
MTLLSAPRCTRRAALVSIATTAWPLPASPAPLLAGVYAPGTDPAPFLVSEKYDGVRALWDGRSLRHRSGRPVAAPASFLAALPAQPLDGELWLGRGRFDALSAIVRQATPVEADWQRVRYVVFELPGAGGRFDERAERIAALASRHDGAERRPFEAAAQGRVDGWPELERRFASVVAAGGEGLMLHLASAPEAHGRSDVLLKLKPQLDAEARVVDHRRGRGRLRDRVGALEVETPAGRRFLIGSGLDDAQRSSPPPVGSLVTYRYRQLTPGGVPRFATFLRRHESF